mgnify:CR=1 FL=1
MTDIDELRQRVIDAARAWRRTEDDYDEAGDLVNAIDALDAAETPDPWELLREYVSDAADADDHTWESFCADWVPRVRAALAWREQNND